MPAYRFPILVLRDAAGFHTVVLVEDRDEVAGFAATAAEARQQVRDFLERRHRDESWRDEPDFHDPRLASYRVDVRAEYVSRERIYPCGETIAVRVPVVTGRTGAGLRVASLPTVDVRFSFYDDDDVKPLVAQYVQQRFKGRTPAEVARFLSPPHVELDDVVIRAPREARERAEAPESEDLAAVADPLASRELRGRYSRAWEREDVIGRLIETLRKETAPVLLVGEPGVGKTSILADVARRLERDATLFEAPQGVAELRDETGRRANRFWLTSAPRLIAGMQYLGMWQERVESVIAQVGSVAGVLCAESLIDLVRTGGRSPADSIGAFLVPYLQRGELRLIAEATPSELDAVRRLLPGLADVFQIVQVPPFTRQQATDCLGHVAAVQRQNLRIEMDRGVVESVYRLFARFMPYEVFPGKAAGFVAELFDRAARRSADRITTSDAIDLFVGQTGVPELFLRDEWPLDVGEVARTLGRDVIGQARACEVAAGVVTTFKAGLNDPARPLGVLLFAGPTGVGKTQLAQSIARVLFGGTSRERTKSHERERRERLIRLDMSEYAGPGAADRFLGSPEAGPAEWIQKIRRQPFTVLLLDEIEKASPDVFDVLLGVFDEGRLSDPWGRLTHFRSAVVVMTSNLGAGSGEPFGLSKEAGSTYQADAMGFFRPEFFNRIDAVVRFDPLSAATVRAIAEKELRDLATREGLSKAGLQLEWTDRLVDHLAAHGFDSRYGARHLQRVIETRLVTPLARYLINRVGAGGRIRVDVSAAGEVLIRGGRGV